MAQMKKRFVSVFVIFAVALAGISHAGAQTSERVADLAWNSTGQLIATVDYYSGTVTVVDNTAQVVFESENNGFGTDMAWDPTSPELLAVSTREQGTSLYDVNTGNLAAHFDTDAITYSVSFSPDGHYIMTSHGTPGDGPVARGYIKVIEIATGSSSIVFEDVPQRVALASWSPNGNLIAGLNIGELGEVVIWDASTGEIKQRLSEAFETTDGISTYTVGSVSDFAWSPGGDVLALGTELQISFWNTTTYNSIRTSDYLFVVEDLDWHPNKPVIAVASGYNRQIQIVDTLSGQVIDVISTLFDPLAVSWNPEGTRLAYGGEAGRLVEVIDATRFIVPMPVATSTLSPTTG